MIIFGNFIAILLRSTKNQPVYQSRNHIRVFMLCSFVQGQPSGEAFIQLDGEQSASNVAYYKNARSLFFAGNKYPLEVVQCSGEDMNMELVGMASAAPPLLSLSPALTHSHNNNNNNTHFNNCTTSHFAAAAAAHPPQLQPPPPPYDTCTYLLKSFRQNYLKYIQLF